MFGTHDVLGATREIQFYPQQSRHFSVAVYSLPLEILTKSKVNHTKSSRHRTSIYPKERLESEQKPKSFTNKTSKRNRDLGKGVGYAMGRC